MKLLVAHGADPYIPTAKPPGRPRTGDADIRQLVDVSGMPEIPIGGPGIPALHAASGAGYSEGFAANSHRYAPSGMLLAVQVPGRGAGHGRQRRAITRATRRCTTRRRAATTR